MKTHPSFMVIALIICAVLIAGSVTAWTPRAVVDDPLIRMPGTQQDDGVSLRTSDTCFNCHANYDTTVEPGYNWSGSMMGQTAKDPLFWATLTVSAQDSIWLIGRPNATDLCLRCHMSAGWLQGRSDPTNAAAMVSSDFDGVECVTCHRQANPFFVALADGTREGNDWTGYWDEATALSTTWANGTFAEDEIVMSGITTYDGSYFFDAASLPVSVTYTEAGAGQYFVSLDDSRRAPFADAAAKHQLTYSRFHKSKYFCNTCHDVSNPAFINLDEELRTKGDGGGLLPSETTPAYAYGHVERTFSEFMLSAYAQPGGADGIGPYGPSLFDTPLPGDKIGACQHCHMPADEGRGCNKKDGILRKSGSTEHPKSGQPVHDFTGGNAFISYILATAVDGSPVYDAYNASLLGQGSAVLTMELGFGVGVNADALLDGSARALDTLSNAADIVNTTYDPASGALQFRIQNNTGHKLPSGYPEGRRIFVNIKLYDGDSLLQEINPYDDSVHTLKGLDSSYAPDSPSLATHEIHDDDLVYEMHASSSFLPTPGKTFHFVLADGRYKDNRIPPQGFDIDNAAARLVRPVVNGGTVQPDLYTTQEYAGGYDDVTLLLEAGADRVEISLLYQTTSREFITFLRDEINGAADTLPATAYIAQDPAEPFFDQLRAWGDTIFELWQYNADVPGAAPVAISAVVYETEPCVPESELCDGLDNNCNDLVDEDFSSLGESCEVGVGQCLATGSIVCTSDGSGAECSVQAGTPTAEQCDALDNNCNGSVDEDFSNLGAPCATGTGVCAVTGVWICSDDGSSEQCNAEPIAPTAESCDGLDNDCNGVVDDGCDCIDGHTQSCYSGAAETINVGVCQSGIQTCADGQYGLCVGEITPGAETCNNTDDDCDGVIDNGVLSACGDCSPVPLEQCDGQDNDCDDLVDEDYPLLGTNCTVGVGACETSSTYICQTDGSGVFCDAAAGTTMDEVCDGVDNDCDGLIDETFAGLNMPCTVGIGACTASGTYVCEGGDVVCNATAGAASTEICDGQDNDCDGEIDNGFDHLNEGCSVGMGICVATGIYTCAEDGSAVICDAATGESDTEICDGLDNDCDGQIDNNPACVCADTDTQSCYSGPTATEDVGICQGGTQSCDNGQWGSCIGETAPRPERCDDSDNNCDGAVDEIFDLDALCVTGEGECAYAGHRVCSEDELTALCDAVAGTPEAESCDGFDNDCDGVVDEDFIGIGSSCSAGTGVCAATGTWECTEDGSAMACSAQPKSADTEQCDGIDNDCDGITDEGFANGQPCNDGNSCTVNDQFGDCTCIGTTYTCEPAMCELSAICDGFGGCDVVWADANMPCDDSDPSTEPDLCSPFGECIGSITDTDTDSSTDTIGTFDSDSEASTDTQTSVDSDTDTADTGTIDTDTNPEPSITDSDSLIEIDISDDQLHNHSADNNGCGCRTAHSPTPSLILLLLTILE